MLQSADSRIVEMARVEMRNRLAVFGWLELKLLGAPFSENP
jgi:hypothetical protein